MLKYPTLKFLNDYSKSLTETYRLFTKKDYWPDYLNTHPLHQNVQRVLSLVKQFNTNIINFIKNPCLDTALKLEESYKLYVQIPREDWNHPKDLDTTTMYSWFNETIMILHKDKFGDFFENRLKDLIKQYRQGNKINYKSVSFKQWRTNFGRLNRNKFKTLLNEPGNPYQPHLIGFLNQAYNPIIGKGFCYGIACYGVHLALKDNNITVKDRLLVSKVQIKEIELYQRYQSSLECIENKKYIVLPTKLSFKTPLEAGSIIANSLKEKLKSVPAKLLFGLHLSLRQNDRSASGHAFGIAKTKDNYFFIDANFGVFKFSINEIDKFCEFIGWFLDKTKYCHYFNQFSITNFPKIEKDSSIPKLPIQLQSPFVITPEEKAGKIDAILNKSRDGLNLLHTAASIVVPDFVCTSLTKARDLVSSPLTKTATIFSSKKRKRKNDNNTEIIEPTKKKKQCNSI